MLTVPIQTVTACPICGNQRRRAVCASPDRQHGVSAQRFVYSRCGGCGVVYQSIRPIEAGIATFYPDDYGPYQASPITVRADSAGSSAGPHFQPRARRVRRWLIRAAARINRSLRARFPDSLPTVIETTYSPPRAGATMLDFGCGSADALDRARQRGWQTIGADFIQPVVDAVERAGHRAVLCDESMWSAIPDGSLDLVRLNHVIEHLYDPHTTFRQLRRKLRTGGKLHLATPNADSAAFRLLGERWYPLECPRHIVIYTPRSAQRLLRSVGFSAVQCFQEVLTKDSARSLGYLLHDLGRIDTGGALGLMHSAGLAEILFAPARLAALVGRSDRFHAIAVA